MYTRMAVEMKKITFRRLVEVEEVKPASALADRNEEVLNYVAKVYANVDRRFIIDGFACNIHCVTVA